MSNKFTELSKIDVGEHIEKKGKFSYLSWVWAVSKLLQEDPKATWYSAPPTFFQDGSVMVYCTVTAFDKSMTMQMPVLDFRNKAISNPNAFDVNTAMQRCLVKTIALHGIGLYIYAGEDLPPDSDKLEERDLSPIQKTGHKEIDKGMMDEAMTDIQNETDVNHVKTLGREYYANLRDAGATEEQLGTIKDQVTSRFMELGGKELS